MGRGEIAFRKSAIDDRDEVSAGVLFRVPDAPLKERDAKRSEIAIVDHHYTGLRLLPRARSVDVEGTLTASIGRCGIGAGRVTGHCDGGHTGNRCDLLPDL